MIKLALLGIFIFLLTGFASAAQICETYDGFESGSLDTIKWEVRQDIEGQSLMDEYGVIDEEGNFAFHTKQNSAGDRRVYLFPKKQFTTGDSIEYDANLISREGTYAQMVLLTGDQSIRIGMRGTDAGFDEIGMAHMKLIFQENNLAIERKTPLGNLLIDNLALTNTNGTYELYIGSFSGSNGIVHIDYDNFVLCREEIFEEPNLEKRIAVLEQKVEDLEHKNEELDNRVSSLEKLVRKIIRFIRDLPRTFSRFWDN